MHHWGFWIHGYMPCNLMLKLLPQGCVANHCKTSQILLGNLWDVHVNHHTWCNDSLVKTCSLLLFLLWCKNTSQCLVISNTNNINLLCCIRNSGIFNITGTGRIKFCWFTLNFHCSAGAFSRDPSCKICILDSSAYSGSYSRLDN